MNSKAYVKNIIDKLLKKYNNRIGAKIETNKRVILKPTEIYKSYMDNNADLDEKQNFNEAVELLLKMEVITVSRLKFSLDIEKIYLLEDKVDILYEYLNVKYGVTPKNLQIKKLEELISKYDNGDCLVKYYSENILLEAKDPRKTLDLDRIENNLRILIFLATNKEELYIREVSMLVYGDSKWFEQNNYDEVCNIIRNFLGQEKAEDERSDTILSYYNVIPVEQEIFIKGNWRIELEDYILDVSKLKGGVSISSGDVKNIKKITVDESKVMTIENKTSYYRMKDISFAVMYLGGFATGQQIEFLVKVVKDNPNTSYFHFGDIDVGGFLIHRHLCREVNKKFELYCMGIEQLSDTRFSKCLKELTDNDINRMKGIMEAEEYCMILKYMKEHNVKLEQEILSYYENK